MTLKNKIILNLVLSYQRLQQSPDLNCLSFCVTALMDDVMNVLSCFDTCVKCSIELRCNAASMGTIEIVAHRVSDIPKTITLLQNKTAYMGPGTILKLYPALGHDAPNPDEEILYQLHDNVRIGYARDIEDPITWYVTTDEIKRRGL